ncbi:flagellar basal-body rod protein FlgF [Taklimakanibacter albus]|uniref:Flagellar basal-body rod protein FlgF n=1 Tax=Taklimakanibacter albus TaxID=2800327 RepID=A0ACC5RAL2_9HYPH|nr:flagellar basal-body rod protein FlgF [Aestuariivirga sp. YIM B02566]MBK1869658.1 flagellar basal-body rod protein FlgF [Aestuariivirga sp. YIM B02566]
MQSGLYVALSAQLALQKRLDTVAGNIANAGTAGFRAEEVKFETLLMQAGSDQIAFTSPGETYLSRQAGELVQTGNPLDTAIKGDGWMAITTPSGTAYTRDGRMRMLESGELQTLGGNPILDVGGAPLLLDPLAGPPRIAADGMISQGNRQMGAIGLFRIPENAKLLRAADSSVIPDKPAEPVLDFVKDGVVQGFVERSNVNPVLEMSRLIQITRAFESVTSVLNESESSLQGAVKALGTGS